MASTECETDLNLLLIGRHPDELNTLQQSLSEHPRSQHWQCQCQSDYPLDTRSFDLIIVHLLSNDLDWLMQWHQVSLKTPILFLAPDALQSHLPEQVHCLPTPVLNHHHLIEACEAIYHEAETPSPEPLQRDAFFSRFRHWMSQSANGLYLRVLQCRWLAATDDEQTPWIVRHKVQQEFEQTILSQAPDNAMIGRILDDQLIVVGKDYYALQADWFPRRCETQENAWMVYSSSVLQLNQFDALSGVLQEGVQQIARERLVQEAQFDWQPQAHSLNLYEGLHLALQRDEFFLEFQPQFDGQTGVWTGAEALLRWKHPTLGVIPPTVFIREAENTGLIQALGHWALRETILAWGEIKRRFDTPIRMAVNVSFPEIADPYYARQVLDLLEQLEMPPHFLELELTETAMMRDTSVSLMNLKTLQAEGIHIVLDDFGTGFSSLSHLSDLPITGIKLDRAFVTPMAEQGPQSHIVTTMLDLAKRLNLETTAEGIEDKQCLGLVQKLGCDRIQGYIYSRPLALEALLEQAESGFSAQDFNQRSLF
ncbi:EAL domain-containing protein [Bacterioplanoides sp.]|uniref:EAL domain-containing protein n=1 Tax=Bacterioplanoides sp. TaxID=2066072 RepID=UPI003B002DF3